MSDTENTTDSKAIPEDFSKIVKDFMKDILITFPEVKDTLHPGLVDITLNNTDTDDARYVFEYSIEKIPKLFFDILYEKERIFDGDDSELLPSLNFGILWKCEITENTKKRFGNTCNCYYLH